MITLNLFGYASGIGGNDVDCGLGPWYLYYHPELFEHLSLSYQWRCFVNKSALETGSKALTFVEHSLLELSRALLPIITQKEPFCVVGGDHSSAIATWSTASHAYQNAGDLGLIWIDAHLDAHTPETSRSQNIHGMPMAHLLGHGYQRLRQLLNDKSALKPRNVCLIGVRSYEEEELVLLQKLGVKLYVMDEIERRGFDAVFEEAYNHVTRYTVAYGLSIDLDGFDPSEAPGVGYREPHGIRKEPFLKALRHMDRSNLIGVEIAEFNPMRDIEQKTAKLIVDIISEVYA